MNQTSQNTIDDYISYLTRLDNDTNVNDINIKTTDDIKSYESGAKQQLAKLEKLSKVHKLYDSNYSEYMLAMGKFAVVLKKDDKLDLINNEKYIEVFQIIHNRFEELAQANIMKDAYVWK